MNNTANIFFPRDLNNSSENGFEDVPFDTVNPVFRFGDGLSY